MELILFFAVFLVLAVAATGLWIWSLVDAVKATDAQWAAAGQSKILWVVLIVVLGLLGTLLYYVVPRPALKRVGA